MIFKKENKVQSISLTQFHCTDSASLQCGIASLPFLGFFANTRRRCKIAIAFWQKVCNIRKLSLHFNTLALVLLLASAIGQSWALSVVSMKFGGAPTYDSGWISLAKDTAQTLTHNLGGNVDNYVVDMEYQAINTDGVNQRYCGGADFGANPVARHSADDRVGAYWRSLDSTSITVYRRPEDTYAPQVRIRIWVNPTPAYDSGWISLAQDAAQTLTHNLGDNVDNYVVDMEYKASGIDGINQRYYGGADFGAKPVAGHSVDDRVGAYWRSLDSTSIAVYRRPEDTYAPQVRIRIWINPTPAYDSGWISLAQDAAQTLTHNLGGNANNYVVDMEYKASDINGINQRYYGGADFGATPVAGHSVDDRVGAYWRSLDNTSIIVYRRPEDTYAPKLRIRIWLNPTPAYDSGWISLAQDAAQTLTHNVGGNVDNYVVDMEYKASGIDGINQRYYGGADFGTKPVAGHSVDDRVGAYWRNLDSTSITVYRRPEDTYAPQVRTRIWVEPTPAYDSGWISLAQDAGQTLIHNLGGNVDDYVVDMQYKASDVNGINQRYYGGADFGAKPVAGHSADDRVGAYWRTLDSTSITVYRRPEDTYAPNVRIRIWVNPAPAYDSGWISLAQDSAQILTHNLMGDDSNYVVDMGYQASSIDGINQRYCGGADFGATPVSGHSVNDRVGAYWRTLDSTSITVYRRPEDTYAPKVRIRIWNYYLVHLPFIILN